MIKINYLKIEIQTEKGLYGFKTEFKSGLNILSSNDNTKGKSSTLSAIFYALGLEEIIGGKGSKALSQAYKLSLTDENGDEIKVLESRIFLEITNYKECITLVRYAKSDTIKDWLIRVYRSEFVKCFDKGTKIEDFYVNISNSATHEKGFHTFLEEFMGLSLPMVPSSDGNRKLYLQLFFSLIFVEQKHGWGGIMSGMPVYNISDPKKRVVEYTLALNTLKNEIEKKKLEADLNSIKLKWEDVQKKLLSIANENKVNLINYPTELKILTNDELNSICFKKDENDLSSYIEELQMYINENLATTQKITEKQLDKENQQLIETQNLIIKKSGEISEKREQLQQQIIVTRKHMSMLETINTDIVNNKDAKKLKDLGSELAIKSLKNICPTCGQEVDDSLLHTELTMSIEENLEHLEAQRKLYEYTILSQNQIIEKLKEDINSDEQEINSLRKLERVLKEDLVRVKNEISEVSIYQKFKIESDIEKLKSLNMILEENKELLSKQSKLYKKYLNDKAKLPAKRLDDTDRKKLKLLCEKFKDYLRLFRYNSVNDLSTIEISDYTYLPTSNGFDMKYDTSASDEIRAIWAYLLAINEVDNEYHTNFAKLIIFDEPKQQSIVDKDFKCFLNAIIEKFKDKQVIVAATLKDMGTINVIKELDCSKFNLIDLGNRAFKKLN